MIFQYYPLDEVLCGGYLISEYKPDIINSVLEKLTPETIRLVIVNQSLADKATLSEPWYGTKYAIEDIPEDSLGTWSDAGMQEDLCLPPRNEFLPTNFSLITSEVNFFTID